MAIKKNKTLMTHFFHCSSMANGHQCHVIFEETCIQNLNLTLQSYMTNNEPNTTNKMQRAKWNMYEIDDFF